MDLAAIHTPVMLKETLEHLAPALEAPSAVVIDATLGMGGHTLAMLEHFPTLTVIGLDRDAHAIEVASERLAAFGARLRLVHTIYDEIFNVARNEGFTEVSAVLFDLGVSSMQLDQADRGFSYSKDAPLDMRMDDSKGATAAEILAEADEERLVHIFREYGEERLATRYARAIVKAREKAPILRSSELVAIIHEATPVVVQRQGHPGKRVFQALRIEVNDELGALSRAIPAALEALAVQGRIVVLSYQSLEDRFVKQSLAKAASSSAPQGLPVELPEHRPEFTLLTRGAEQASEAEIDLNPRAKPVRLRAAERIRRAA